MPPYSVKAVIEHLNIKLMDEEIFRLSRAKLKELFTFKNGGTNSSSLVNSIIYQDFLKFQSGEFPPLRGNLRSYWYARIKPVLSRARAKKLSNKYDMMIAKFAKQIRRYHLFSYETFGFIDSDAHQRIIGGVHRQVFVVAEKVGHLALLRDLSAVYDVTTVALGGQPFNAKQKAHSSANQKGATLPAVRLA